MIPKVIHYCWFGGNPLPPLAKKCIASWRRFLPDYEVKEWNERNFDVNIIPYTRDAYRAGKYAFVSDYARFWILYQYGGLYFDTDVEVIRPLDDIIARGPFMGCESEADVSECDVSSGGTPPTADVAPGLGLGVNPGLGLYREMLDLYETMEFTTEGLPKTVVAHTTELLCRHGLRCTNEIQTVAGVTIYPKEYFCPLDYWTQRLDITPNTRTIHHYAASWIGWPRLMKRKLEKWMPWTSPLLRGVSSLFRH